eukprot:COSAG01_NODE_19320_length_1017_cov_9.034858_2_plen_34_part_01
MSMANDDLKFAETRHKFEHNGAPESTAVTVADRR